ncbi:MAG: hypothetical protein IPK58_22225 [Acidobacteria bacterium]|nr:hypothetical protein [Acidobacteriota bacterium]
MSEYKRDEWSLGDGVIVGVTYIHLDCDDLGDWYIDHAEYDDGDEATELERFELQDMNPDKFADLVRETIDAEAEARAEDNYE